MMKQYKIKYIENSKVKTQIVSKDQLNNLPKNTISIKCTNRNFLLFQSVLNKKQIYELFSQILIMLDADIVLIDAIELLLENEQKEEIRKFLLIMQRSLHKGELLKDNLIKSNFNVGILPLIFLDLGQKNADMKTAVRILVKTLEDQENNKQKILKVIQYPSILLVSFIISVGIIFIYLIPQFEPLFAQFGNNLPIETKILLYTKDFFQKYTFHMVIFLSGIGLILYFFYKTKKFVKYYIHSFVIYKIPVVSKLLVWYNLYVVFSIIHLLVQQHNTLLQAFEQTSLLIKNQIIKEIFSTIQKDISMGVYIHEAFQKHKIFDPIVLKLILVGHSSDQFDLIFGRIVVLYQKRYDKRVDQLIKLIEPIFLFVMALFIVWIMLAIFIPLWDMGKVL